MTTYKVSLDNSGQSITLEDRSYTPLDAAIEAYETLFPAEKGHNPIVFAVVTAYNEILDIWSFADVFSLASTRVVHDVNYPPKGGY